MNDYDDTPPLDEILDSISSLKAQALEIENEREEHEKLLASHRPEMLERIVGLVTCYVDVMGGTVKEVTDAVPSLVADKKPEQVERKSARGRRQRTGGWIHHQTGITYKGGALPSKLKEVMVEQGVDLTDKEAKKAWVELNCEQVG